MSDTLAASPESARPTVSSRRLKKREIDRRCQRLARERTKNRITELEALVESLRSEDSSDRLANLMTQLDEMARERRMLIKTIRSIHHSVQEHASLFGAADSAQSPPKSSNRDPQDSPAPVSSVRPTTLFSVLELPSESTDRSDGSGPFATPHREILAVESPTIQRDNATINLDPYPAFQDWSNETEALAAAETQVLGIEAVTDSMCPCSASSISQQSCKPLNLWHFAKTTLAEPADTNDMISHIEDSVADDTPIRALVEGWDSVKRRMNGRLPPSWDKLRRIDETLFPTCGSVERLAIMRVMHLLFRHHNDPYPDHLTQLPHWMLKRPSQMIDHSYAIDYFAWPGIRERFVFHQHKYCGNEFWELFRSSFRILWPFEFRDCYTRNITTGQYSISNSFDKRIRDINVWRMGRDIFQRWPEFYSDMPALHTITMPLSLPEFQSPSLDVLDETNPETAEEQATNRLLLDLDALESRNIWSRQAPALFAASDSFEFEY